MDEATANIDENTDAIIQKLIKDDFKKSTIVTIAHRLNTIIQYDLILVLDQGTKVEEGTPYELLKTDGSYFKSLVDENGKAFAQKMLMLAKQHANNEDNNFAKSMEDLIE